MQQLTAASSSTSLSLGQNLLAEMRRRFLNIESNYLLASTCLLDPRFKKLGFTDTGALDTANRHLLGEMTGATFASPEPENERSVCSTTTSNTAALWVQFDQRVWESPSERSTGVDATVERRQYIQSRNISRDDDPLKWWAENQCHLPQLQLLARKYLCIPGTSVSSERLFSKAGQVVQARRSNLKPSNVDKICF